MIDPRTAPDAITVPYRIDRDAIIDGLRLANRRGPLRARAPTVNGVLALIASGVCTAWPVVVGALTAAWFQRDTTTPAFYVSDEFLYTALVIYSGTLCLVLWVIYSFMNRGIFPEQVDRLIGVLGTLPREGRLSLSRHGIAAETSLGLNVWAPPMLLAAHETPQSFVFVSRLQGVIALPKQGLSPEEILAVRDRVRSGVLGRTG